jgi:hypothetical protein
MHAETKKTHTQMPVSSFGGLGVSMLVSGSQVRGFEKKNPRPKPSDFSGRKKSSGEVKPSVPCRRFTACKRSLQIAWNSSNTRYLTEKLNGHFSPIFSPFPARGLSRRRCRGSWQYKRELPKPGSYNKPAGCSTSGGTSNRGPEEEEEVPVSNLFYFRTY